MISLFKSKEQKFWSWFQKNEDRLPNFEQGQEAIFKELHSQIMQVNKDLVFEFGPVVNGKREFILSAGGILSVFPDLEKLYSAAPQLDKWSVIKFRPRREPCDLVYGGKNVKFENINYVLIKDESPDKVGIVLFFNEFNEAEYDLWLGAGFLFLDQVLGEYDVATKLGNILVTSPQSEHFSNARPLRELTADFDSYFQ
ncbi:hypothetical protein [Methanolobus profundi]|uniref:Uncharacterized protein n=1 Tax=Methanolobus profundi TaxID=487685 RepID=A0A1I4TPD5_9EURY|nr:hypothetical protein [Methanolobus profundi]SFM78618.1 hypothetical protein SAMN04488696_2380 [Methanolobus profundi]